MSSNKKGLGRSFSSLLPSELLNEAFDPTAGEDEKMSDLRQISIDDIRSDPHQPRQEFDGATLTALTDSIKKHGIVQPLIVTPGDTGSFTLVAGERRWRAAKKAGLKKVPALVRTLSAQHKLEISLIENLQREDLNSLETATAYLKLRDQFNMKLEDISRHVGGRSVAVISNTIRLLQLPIGAKAALIKKQISEGHARQILALTDADMQTELLKQTIKNNWSVRRAEQFVIGYKKAATGEKQRAARDATKTQTPLTKALAKRLNTPVKVKTTAKGGQLIIGFKDEKDLKRIIENL